ncbi:MAG: Ig-like domain-containing protein [Armatimonadota bacterium]
MKFCYRWGLLVVVLALSLPVILTGCGGGSEVAGPHGSMTLSVHFPPLPQGGDKVLPSALMSVVIDILDPTQSGNPPKVDAVVLNRPDSSGGSVTVNVPDVGVGETLIKARGFDALDGGGKLIIIASTTCTVELNKTASVTMTMDPTTTTIILSGSSSVLVSKTALLSASATDIDGNPMANPTFGWKSSDDAVATVVPYTGTAALKTGGLKQATVTGVTRGKVTITVTDTISGAEATMDMDVNPDIDEVVVDPTIQTVNKDKTFKLTAKAFSGSTEITNVDFSFTSENSDVASAVKSSTVDNEATVGGVSPGKTRIEVTQPYTGAKAYCDVTVTANGSIDITIE